MPRSRKRHHSRSRSRSLSRSLSRDRSHKRNDSYDKDGKRRRVDDIDSPPHKRSLSSESHNFAEDEVQRIQDVNEHVSGIKPQGAADLGPVEIKSGTGKKADGDKTRKSRIGKHAATKKGNVTEKETTPVSDSDHAMGVSVFDSSKFKKDKKELVTSVGEQETVRIVPGSTENTDEAQSSKEQVAAITQTKEIHPADVSEKLVTLKEIATSEDVTIRDITKEEDGKAPVSDFDDGMIVSDSDSSKLEIKDDRKEKCYTPKKPLTPRQLQKRLESEKKKQQKQKERDEREKQRQEEKAKFLAEKEKNRIQKEAERQKLVEQKQKEREMKEEQKRKEKEEFEQKRKEKEQRRKEKEEQESQKRKEKELEKLKKQQEIEEKNKEKQREEEKKQKTAALFVGFFKKTDGEEKERKPEKVNSNFMPFEVKSDMRLPPMRRNPLRGEDMEKLDLAIEKQDWNTSYLKELKSGVTRVGKTTKTWPYQDPEDEVTIVEEDKILGEKICDDKSIVHKTKAKFLFFHDNRRPAYFGTWRKRGKFVRPRRPFGQDPDIFNYDEDSDDDWEDEEQGESLDASADEEDKEGENAEDEYEVDNEFFVPHGHLSDDEIDDEENSRLSPESLKQKLKLLKDEFDEDIKSKTHKLKPRSIGCIWYSKKDDNVEDAIQRYLQPFAMIVKGQIEIKNRLEIFTASPERKKSKVGKELPPEHIPYFLKIIHGNINRKKLVIEQFLTYMANNGLNVEVSKINLLRFLKQTATYKRCKENGPMKNKFGWFVNEEINKKYNINLELPAKTENSSC